MKRGAQILAAFLALLVVVACGGGGVGSGGTGITVGGGVGSGGTGISVGPIKGFGSIIVNGVRYDIDTATQEVDDVVALGLGMVVEVTGSTNADFSTGTATRVRSAADLRGPAGSVDTVAGTLQVQGTLVGTDTATVYAGTVDLTGISNGDPVMVHGLPDSAGQLRATRIERLAAAGAPIVTGVVAGLNGGLSRFNLGTLTVDYTTASFVGGLSAGQLSNGMRVRVRAAAAPVAGVLTATSVQAWYAVGGTEGSASTVSGVVTDFSNLGSFRLLGQLVDASQAQITGGLPAAIGNGVLVEVDGTVSQGILVATQLKIRHVPGTGGPASFSLSGPIGAYVSSSSFRVKGQPVDASGGGVVFSGGTIGQLGNGVMVQVVGSEVVNGVLIADSVTFLP